MKSLLLLLPAAILYFPLPVAADGNVLTWTGAASGTWNNSGGGWSGGFPPFAQTSVNLDGNVGQDSTVSLSVNAEIMNLYIDAGDTLRITGGNQLNLIGVHPLLIADQMGISGTLDMSEGGDNRLRINTSNTFRSGSGRVLMRGQALIYGPGIYFQQSGVTAGSGIIGGAGMGLNNQGVIAAGYSGETLSLLCHTRADMNNRTFNSGSLSASGGGILAVTMSGGGILDNSGGFIEPEVNSLVRFDGVPVSGGVIRGAGVAGFATRGPNSLSGLRNEGMVDQMGGILSIGAGVTNAGTIRSSGYTPGFSDGLRFDTPVTMNGGGRLLMGNGASDGFITGVGSLSLGTQTVEGYGNLGGNQLSVTVSPVASVRANVAGRTLRVDPPGAGFTNQGLMLAENGGILHFFSDAGENLNCHGGVLMAGHGSRIDIQGFLAGGTLRTSSTGVIRFPGSSSMTSVRNEGSVEVNGSCHLNGAITNTGFVRITGNLYAGSGATVDGGGTIHLGTADNSWYGVLTGPGGSLTIGAQRVEGWGVLGQEGINFRITNSQNGVISASVPGLALWLRNSSGTCVNDGVFRAENGGNLQLYSGDFAVGAAGRVEALDGSQVTSVISTLTNHPPGGALSGGTWLVRGRTATASMAIPGGSISANNASITLDGTLSIWTQLDALATNAGRFELAGSRDFTSAGAFSNTGTLVLGSGSVFTSAGSFTQTGKTQVAIAGAPGGAEVAGRLAILTASTLGGTLHVHFDRTSGFVPAAGQTWRVVSGPALTGTFASVLITGLPLTLQGSITYVSGGGVDISLTDRGTYNFNQWAANFAFNSPADSAPDADPDGDALANRLEFAFLLDPLVRDSQFLPTPQRTPAGLTVSFTRPTGITGVTYGAQSSTNLDTWPVVPDSGSGNLVTFNASAGASPRLFMRLNASVVP